ncbi:MAG: hypothetical protein DHS20C18_29570 [Saprospiraceae bacterium]|nr:MAG: hypothetical protein DHS20C18_29570 [Saprospiraceae bacterium]
MKILFTICLFIATFLPFGFSITTNWTGGAGDGNWSTPANWDNGVPGVNDEAVFTNINATISSATGTPQISRIFVKGGGGKLVTLNINMNINGQGIADEAVQVNAGQLTFGLGFSFNIAASSGQNGILANNSNALITNNGLITVSVTDEDGINIGSGGILNNNGTLNIDGGANDQRTLLVNNGTLNNNNTLNLVGGKQFSRAQINETGILNNNNGAILDTGDGRIKVNGVGFFNNSGLLMSTINSPLRTDAGATNIINNGFYKYGNNPQNFSDDGTTLTGTNNGIDLNDVTKTTIDAGGICIIDIAESAYEYFDGANSVGSTNGSGSLTLGANVLSSDPVTLTTTLPGVSITIQNVCESAVLPIELVHFTAIPMEKEVMIKWQTALEINNNYMVIERSKNGRAFAEIGRMQGAGFSNVLLDYEWKDRQPFSGQNYYRLRQVDFDGTTSYSEVASVEFKKTTNILSVYPSLIRGQSEVTVDLTTLKDSPVIMDLFSTKGQLLQTYTLNGGSTQKLSTTILNKGMYILKIRDLPALLPVRIVKIE